MFSAVEKEVVDAAVINYTLAKHAINNEGFKDLFIVDKIKLIDDQYAVGFRYGSDMSKKVNDVINMMMNDGSLIAKKYDFLDLYVKKRNKSHIISIIVLVVSYIVLIIIT